MPANGLKLKQASAVLNIPPKELQNLVQFGVIKPDRSAGSNRFDTRTLLAAKLAYRLKESLGARAGVLALLIDAYTASQEELTSQNPEYLAFTFRLSGDEQPIRIEVPFRSLAGQINEGLTRAGLYRDLPPGPKRPGWKTEFLQAVSQAAQEMGDVSEEEILNAVRDCRKRRRVPEITVASAT